MICESVNSDQEEKEGHVLNSNCIMNLKILITNMDKFLVCKEFAQERELQINYKRKDMWKTSLIMLRLIFS